MLLCEILVNRPLLRLGQPLPLHSPCFLTVFETSPWDPLSFSPLCTLAYPMYSDAYETICKQLLLIQ